LHGGLLLMELAFRLRSCFLISLFSFWSCNADSKLLDLIRETIASVFLRPVYSFFPVHLFVASIHAKAFHCRLLGQHRGVVFWRPVRLACWSLMLLRPCLFVFLSLLSTCSGNFGKARPAQEILIILSAHAVFNFSFYL